ncbi:aldehyde dehydrogenase family protein [Curvibacter sp. APW13]|uniref:aldehyde dehydrogenase family protein n=1 Tax=Curvibacter sp. APW13 TaxID=3077236 RepID=UPI0028E0909C|nr:aldehyde dehydrogenase family protein [Curvibacter sp. APW13]MDT8990525.1 aldehyde dehydrogenase family protein [Curvibacter sp. APW13]
MSTPTQDRMRALSGQHYIHGQFLAGTGATHPITDPASLEHLGHYADATEAEVNQAVACARAAQRDWWALSSTERAEALHAVANRMEAIAAEVGECLTREMGKPYREAHWEAGASASAFRYYAELARHDQGRVAGPAVAGQWHMTFKEPLGTIVSIVPYNFPALLFGWQAAAALAAGNAVIVKPSELTSLTLLMLMEAFAELPPGLVQLLTGGAAVGAQLVAHEHTHGIAFTGSVRAAQAVAKAAAERFKPVLSEASGNDPFIVMPSAPVEVVARGAAFAAFLNCGQVCTSAERFYVHEAVYEPFVQALTRHAQALRLGHGLDKVDMGPLANERELLRVERVLARAVEQGAVVRCGNRRPPQLNKGWFWEPTVLEVRHDMEIMHQEIFGPIAPVCKVASLDEAIRYANDSEFGLGANIYTHDLNEAMRAVAEIESGIVWVNTPLNDNDCVPFGGRKMTGSGRELGAEGLEQFRRSKMVMMAPQALDDEEWFPYPDADAFGMKD